MSSDRCHCFGERVGLPLVGRGAPPVPRGLSFAVVRSGGRPCCAVLAWFYTTHPGPTVPDPPPPLRSVRPHGVPPCLALLPSLCTRCRPRRVLCVASLVVSVVVVGGLTPAPWLRSNPVPLRSWRSLLILARAAPRPRKSRPQGRGYRSKTYFGVPGVSGEALAASSPCDRL